MNAQERVALSFGLMVMELEALKDMTAQLQQELSKQKEERGNVNDPKRFDPITPEG